MADRSYGGRREAWRARGSSIFPDDDDDRRLRGPARPAGRDEERGFFERAGDEVRSWFGDEEAERRRERDLGRDPSPSSYEGGGEGTSWRSRAPYGGYGLSEHRGATGDDRDAGGYGLRDLGGRSDFTGQSRWDDNYRRWRDQQIERFDREYEDYCRERQHRFDQDFDRWRTSRLTEGGTTGTIGAAAGASATRASTGSSPIADTNAPAGSEAGASPRGRGRSRG